MINEIWESIKRTFSIVYEKILSKLVKTMFMTLALFCIYFFMVCLISYEIGLAFANLFAAMVFFRLFEEGD